MMCDDRLRNPCCMRSLYRFICIRVHSVIYIEAFGEYVLTVCVRYCALFLIHRRYRCFDYCRHVDLWIYFFYIFQISKCLSLFIIVPAGISGSIIMIQCNSFFYYPLCYCYCHYSFYLHLFLIVLNCYSAIRLLRCSCEIKTQCQ